MGRLLWLGACVAVALAAATPASAAERLFSKRFGQTMRGDITIAGNILHTCNINDTGGPGGTCADARAGNAPTFTNNEHQMQQVDVDSDVTTFNSSMATLDLPADAIVRFAALYWAGTGSNTAGSSTAPDITKRGTVQIDSPAPGGYQPVTTTTVDDLPEPAAEDDYVAFADVTGLVAAAGEGEYAVADVQSAIGFNTYAGWTLVVAFESPAAPLRNLTVFDGYQFMCNCGTGHPTVTNTISGFRTPATGPVLTRAGIIGFEGEVASDGTTEGVLIDGNAVSGALNPSTDLFNGTITAFGSHVTTKTPNQVNQISSLDADLIESSGLLAADSTDAELQLVANTGDGWYAQALTFATEVEQPLVSLTKTVSDVDGAPARPGELLEYTITATNDGNDDADDVVITDVLPAEAPFEPGTLTVDGVAVTDADDGDAGELVAGTITGRVGNIPPGGQKSVVLRARIGDSVASGTEIANEASAVYEIPQSAIDLDAASAPVTVTVADRLQPVATPTPTPTPTAAPTAAPVVTPTPTPAAEVAPTFASVVKLPSNRKCVSRRSFRIRLVEPKGDALVSATVFVNGKRIRVVRGNRLRARVDLRGLPKGRFTVRIVARTKAGRTIRGSRKYRTCVPKKKSGGRTRPRT